MTTATSEVCPGPLVWFSAGPGLGAVLECAACGHIVTTGNLMDERHAGTPLLREGLASR